MSFLNVLNVYFKLKGQSTVIQAKSYETFAEVALRFLQLKGLTEEEVIFIFNARKIDPQSSYTLEDYKIFCGSTIQVTLTEELIGGPPKTIGPILTIIFMERQKDFSYSGGLL